MNRNIRQFFQAFFCAGAAWLSRCRGGRLGHLSPLAPRLFLGEALGRKYSLLEKSKVPVAAAELSPALIYPVCWGNGENAPQRSGDLW